MSQFQRFSVRLVFFCLFFYFHTLLLSKRAIKAQITKTWPGVQSKVKISRKNSSFDLHLLTSHVVQYSCWDLWQQLGPEPEIQMHKLLQLCSECTQSLSYHDDTHAPMVETMPGRLTAYQNLQINTFAVFGIFVFPFFFLLFFSLNSTNQLFLATVVFFFFSIDQPLFLKSRNNIMHTDDHASK